MFFAGCGKSTLLKLLYGNQKAGKRSGTILFNGKDPHDGNYHRSVNFVPQQDTHIGTFGSNNLLYDVCAFLTQPHHSHAMQLN